MIDFDRIIERRGTDCVKYDFMAEHDRSENTIPLFVADMDFPVAEKIQQALHQAVDRQIYGYTACKDDYFEAVAGWYRRRYGWALSKDWLVTSPGVVHALNICVRAFTAPDDGVLVLTPVYGPFGAAVKNNGRKLVASSMRWEGTGYQVDWADFEAKAKAAKLFLLCSPHNPVGRVWTKEELTRMGEICLENGIRVVADEIHSDFVYSGYKHINFAAISASFAENSVTCTAPSKTFNLAGLWNSNLLVPNAALRTQVKSEMSRCNSTAPTLFAYAACKAAYTYGDRWLDELLVYLEGNIKLVRDFFAEYFPSVRFTETQGTYLMWGDFSSLGTPDALDKALKEGGIWLSRDSEFNVLPAGFYRINVAAPRPILQKALERMKRIFESLS